MLQLLAIGEDGQNEVKILQRLHLEPISKKFPNRAVPLLEFVTYEQEQMVFGVFPLVSAGYNCPYHAIVEDAFKICYAWMQVSLHWLLLL